MEEQWVEWTEGRRVPVRWSGAGARTIVLAHGAGGHRDHPGTTSLRDAMAANGLRVVTFDYPYRVPDGEGRRVRRPPDRAAVLLAAHRAVVEEVLARSPSTPVLAGRSMGGRMSTLLASEGIRCGGVVLYAYPLHPPGRPDRLRVDHLGAVPVPMLFFQGDRDPLSRSDLFDRHVRPLADVTVVDLPGADHSLRTKDRTAEEVTGILAQRTREWIDGL